jgi:hypothetical protein
VKEGKCGKKEDMLEVVRNYKETYTLFFNICK